MPYWRHARLHAEGIALFNSQLFKLVHGADKLRIVHRISQATQRDDGVHHGGINRSQSIAHLEAFKHPLLRLPQSQRTQRTDVHPLEPMRQAIQHQKEITPRNQLRGPGQMHPRLPPPTDKKLLHSHFVWNFLEWLLRVTNRKWNENRARP